MAVGAVVRRGFAGDLAGRLAELRALRGPAVDGFTGRVRDLVVIASSSRGGSSMVTELLRHSPRVLHLRAEINPFLRLAGLGHPDSATGSDRLGAEHLHALAPHVRQELDRELALDAGTPCDAVDDEQYALDVAWRITVQWPDFDLDPRLLTRLALRVLGEVRAARGWRAGEVRDVVAFHLALLEALRAGGLPVDARYYDLPAARRGSGEPLGAPGDTLVEEPPFVLTQPWRRADEHDVAHKSLVVKTPSNAYRIGFLRALFPHARLRVVHLTRNPAAAINGLYDGWRHDGFHAHRVAEPLRISGYADHRPQDRLWWKFDLPPGWREYTDAPLTRVCGFQWHRCHQAVLDEVAPVAADTVRIRFEDLIRSRRSRVDCARHLAEWLGVPFDGALRRAAQEGIGPVVATAAPAPARWRARAGLILRAVRGPVRDLAERLGYDAEDGWI
ncbi:sulfotransferase [Saccharothrix australiensis]|uniref:Sulfotransferase family protein n=1 Tax=Saccharothrix australiensis TaxID=2072 RepID=A0A495W1S8_9PSEU|nr:sulfotransferase [Saccharothrix australiensis]RKT53818.1 sulfotransferase family protein [Saccharothrix australiensis]